MDYALLDAALAAVQSTLGTPAPTCALILGSGWGDVVDSFPKLAEMDYSRIPALGSTTVQGHSGRLVLVEAAGRPVLIFQGRHHWYEGKGWEPIAVPVYVARKLGARVLFLTNAAGGIMDGSQPGDLMAITDHINMMGAHPLIGEHNPVWGPRFPDMTRLYDPELTGILNRAAGLLGMKLQQGVYAAMTGPTYETAAEVRMLKTLGAGAVGMSTVPEAILGHAAGLRVMGLSCISNAAAGLGDASIATHEQVLQEMEKARGRMKPLLQKFFQCLHEAGSL